MHILKSMTGVFFYKLSTSTARGVCIIDLNSKRFTMDMEGYLNGNYGIIRDILAV